MRDRKQTGIIEQINKTTGTGLEIKVKAGSNIINDALLYKPPNITMSKTSIPHKGNFIIKEKIYAQNASLKRWLLVCSKYDE